MKKKNVNAPKKYVVMISPKNAPKSRFFHREFNTKEEAEKKVSAIKKIPMKKRTMLNPRVAKNRFYNRGIWKV